MYNRNIIQEETWINSLWKSMILVSFFLYPLLGSAAPVMDTVVIDDLTDEFIVYDPVYDSYIPLTGAPGTSVSIYKDLRNFSAYGLKVMAKPGLTVFINQKQYYSNTGKRGVELIIPISDLIEQVTPKSLITFYHPKGELPEKALIINPGARINLANGGGFTIQKRGDTFKEEAFWFLLVIAILIAWYKTRYPKRIPEYLGIGRLIESDENVNLYDFFTFSSISLIFINSLAIAYIFSIFSSGWGEKEFSFSLTWLYTLVIFLSFYIKYLLIQFIGGIFNIRQIARIHFLEIIKVSLGLSLVVLPVLTIFYFSDLIEVKFSYMGLAVVFTFILLVVLFRLLVITFRVPNFKYIYLFSYFCIAEIIPLGFILKITLFSI